MSVSVADTSDAALHRDRMRALIADNASLTWPYVLMNALSTAVATFGLLANSTAVVIGAMVIAVLLGPITGLALGLVEGNTRLLIRAALAELVGMAVVLAVAFALGLVYHDIPVGSEILARTAPNTLDLSIALAGGAAGAYATVSPRLGLGLVGVAIATALVPPLASCSLLLTRGEYTLAGGAFLLFVTNLVAIQVASSAVFLFMGYYRQPSGGSVVGALTRNGVSLVVLGALIVALGINLRQTVAEQLFETSVRAHLTQDLQAYPGSYLDQVRFDQEATTTLVTAVVRTPTAFTAPQVAALAATLPLSPTGESVDLHVRSVITIETSPQGTVYPTAP